jgi:hypothetical protein
MFGFFHLFCFYHVLIYAWKNRLLIQLVQQYGVRKWSHIAQMLPGRIGKQCRERWHNHLRPDIKVLITSSISILCIGSLSYFSSSFSYVFFHSFAEGHME